MRIGRIPYVNCYPVYGAIDRNIVSLKGDIVDGVPSALNAQMAAGTLDVSVVSAVEYARDAQRYSRNEHGASFDIARQKRLRRRERR